MYERVGAHFIDGERPCPKGGEHSYASVPFEESALPFLRCTKCGYEKPAY